MFPTDFPESNHVFDKPPDATRDECEPLNVFAGELTGGVPGSVSCWKVTKEELEEINRTGRVWAYHWGSGLQPHALSGHNPFKQEEGT